MIDGREPAAVSCPPERSRTPINRPGPTVCATWGEPSEPPTPSRPLIVGVEAGGGPGPAPRSAPSIMVGNAAAAGAPGGTGRGVGP